MDGFVLAIDQGTTGTTALVFDRDGRVRGRGYSEFTQHYPRPGRVEHDAEELWRVSLGAVEAGLKAAGVAARDLRAVGITNKRETVVAWARATSAPVARAVVAGRRTAAMCDELKARGLGIVRGRPARARPYFPQKLAGCSTTRKACAGAARGESPSATVDSGSSGS